MRFRGTPGRGVGGVRVADLVAEESPPAEAGPGDFVYVAPGAIHRESNPTDVESLSPPAEHSDTVHAVRCSPPTDHLA